MMKRNLNSAVSDSTVSQSGWQNTASSSSSNSNCCFEVVESGLNSADPPEGGFVDLNATCSHDSHTLGTGVLACDMPNAPLAMANRTLFIRSWGSVLGMRGVTSDVVGRGRGARSGQSTTRHGRLLLLLLLFSYCSHWTHSHKLRILWLVMIDLWFVIQSHFTIDFIWSTIHKPKITSLSIFVQWGCFWQ